MQGRVYLEAPARKLAIQHGHYTYIRYGGHSVWSVELGDPVCVAYFRRRCLTSYSIPSFATV